MADGWRNRNMAPVYALVISFVLVLVFGLILRTGGPTPADPSKSTPAQEKQSAQDEPEEDQGPGWKVKVTSVDKTSNHPLTVDEDSNPDDLSAFAISGDEVTEVTDLADLTGDSGNDKVIVCVELPEGWSMLNPKKGKAVGAFTCSEPILPKNDTVTLTMVAGG